jgi:dihydrofolate reductase
MNIIVNVDNNWAIGCENKLLVSIPADMKYFRQMTTGKVILLGRKTLETFPQGQPLKDRVNIVMTQKAGGEIKGAKVVHSVEEALEEVKKYSTEDVFVVGGASIYKQFLPYCDTAYVTKTDYSYQADTWFPKLDALPDWELTKESEEQTYYDLTYCFQKYVRKNT